MKLLLACTCILTYLGAALGLDNGLGSTPQMGFNSWNHYHCGVNETVLKQTADAIVSKGLDKLGYKYVNVDDCWAKSRGSNGVIHAARQ